MEEVKQHFCHIMLYDFMKGKKSSWNAKKKKKKKTICAVYGDGAVPEPTCQKWFVKFCAEDFS